MTQVLIPRVCLCFCTGAVNKDNSRCHGVVTSGLQFAGCLREDNTTLQPPLQTRQCSMLVITRDHIYNPSMYICSGFCRGTIRSRLLNDALQCQRLRQRRRTSQAKTEFAPHMTIWSKLQVDTIRRQRSPSTRSTLPTISGRTMTHAAPYHSFVRNIFIIIYYATSFKVKIWLDHFGL